MSKQIFERREQNRIKNSQIDATDLSSISDINDKSNITTNSFNIKEEINDKDDFEEYKKEVDRILEEKKKKLELAFTFNKTNAEEKVKEKYEKKLEEALKEERENLESQYNKKKIEIENQYKEKLKEQKEKIKKDLEKEYKKKNDQNKNQNKIKIDNLNKEIEKLQNELNNLQKENDNNNKNLDTENEIKKLELESQKELNNYQNTLSLELEKKKNELIELYEKKKIDYEQNLIAEQDKINQNKINSKMASSEALLQNKKNMLNIANESKLEHYKNSLMNELCKDMEKEKKEIVNNFQNEITIVKNNFENLKNFYEQQKLIFQAEQSVTNGSSFIDKMQNVIENKNAVFKSLLEQNYFILKKKIKEIENLKEIEVFSNKDNLIEKIQEILNMIFYANIYETLYNDLNSEKDVMNKYLDDLIKKCEMIIATFNSEKKIQLGMYLCNPNFN